MPTWSVWVDAYHLLTLAVAPDSSPVTISFLQNVPTPTVAPAPIVTVADPSYPEPALVILIADIVPPTPRTASAVAVFVGVSVGVLIVTDGTVEYPTPPFVTVIVITPCVVTLGAMVQVAAAPVPPPPVNDIVGTVVYPRPPSVICIFSMDVTLFLVVVIATAVAVLPTPMSGAENTTVGALV